MIVKELIEILETMPKSAEVTIAERIYYGSYHLTLRGVSLMRKKGRRSYVKIVPDDIVWATE